MLNPWLCQCRCTLSVVNGRDKEGTIFMKMEGYPSPGGGGGGGHSGTEGGRTLATYFAEEGVFFEDLCMSAIL